MNGFFIAIYCCMKNDIQYLTEVRKLQQVAGLITEDDDLDLYEIINSLIIEEKRRTEKKTSVKTSRRRTSVSFKR